MTVNRPSLTVAVIAKNEADRIGRLLDSVPFADEIVVVDSGSTDGTRELCERMGARVLFNEWRGYIPQRRFAVEAAKGRWILSLDADEVVSEPLGREIMEVLEDPPHETSGFSVPRLSRYLGRWIRHGGWYPDRKIRLVRRGMARWAGIEPHDFMEVSGRVERLKHPILHYGYRNIADQVETINRFSDIAASQSPAKGRWYIPAGLAHLVVKFLECYVVKLGLLDGLPGLVIAVNSAWYVFLKHAKRWEKGLEDGGGS